MATRVLLPLLLLAGSLGLYLLNNRFVESTDTVGNELLPISILQQHSLTFDQYYAQPDTSGAYPTGSDALVPGSVPTQFTYRLAPESPTKSIPWWFVRHGEHVVSLYPIATGVLNTPVFFAASLLGVDLSANVVPLTHVTSSVIAALSVVLMYTCFIQFGTSKNTAVFLTLCFAVGTAVWSLNSRSLFQHGAAVLFITAALAALLSRRPRLVAAAGLLLGLAVATRPTNVVIAGALALYVFRHERRAFAAFAALAAIPAALVVWYSWVYWGSPLALGQGQGLSGFTASEPLSAAAGLLLSPNRGLLVFSPIFLFSLGYSIYLVWRRTGHPLLHYLVWSGVLLYALYTLWSDWAGGHTFGYRYMIELVPGLMLVLAACWPRFIQPVRAMRAAFLIAMVASVYVNGIGADAAPCGFDDEPNNIDMHHERLWDVADGEIARCTRQELVAWQEAVASQTARRSPPG
jgi:hypothetical protein